jgi:hypothetical protein
MAKLSSSVHVTCRLATKKKKVCLLILQEFAFGRQRLEKNKERSFTEVSIKKLPPFLRGFVIIYVKLKLKLSE